MAFDGVTVASLVSEFNKKILNGRIYKIAQTESDELLLTIKVNRDQYRLLISAPIWRRKKSNCITRLRDTIGEKSKNRIWQKS